VASALLAPVDEIVEVSSRGFELPGRLTVPERGRGLVVFVCDVSDARSAHDRDVVAGLMRERGLGTLLLDLCSPDEVESGTSAIDADVLAVRLLVATRWLSRRVGVPEQTIAYFGARSGAAVALLAAAEEPAIGAVAARSARLDDAVSALAAVRAPTLFIVGGADPTSRAASERAATAMTCGNELAIVPGASERFREPGALEASARAAGAWFLRHLGADRKETRTHESHH
jgi:dienelactone hydrolase